MIFILGDMGYDMRDNFGTQSDAYYEMIEESIARAPFMAINGNHDMTDIGRLMNFRFRWPGSVSADDNNEFQIIVANTLFFFLNSDFFQEHDLFRQAKIMDKIDLLLDTFYDLKGDKFKILLSHRPFKCIDFDLNETCHAFNDVYWGDIDNKIL